MLFRLALSFFLGTSLATVLAGERQSSLSRFPKCHIVVSGHDWGFRTEFNHEMAHCWGWEHPEGTEGTRYLFPPLEYVMKGDYPNVNYPAGLRTSYNVAKQYCGGHSACQWFGAR